MAKNEVGQIMPAGEYLSRIQDIKKEFLPIRNEIFVPVASGTHHKVFGSDKYVIRFRDDNAESLLRETDFLRKIEHQLVPRVAFLHQAKSGIAMVENRLVGEGLEQAWKKLSSGVKSAIAGDVVDFLKYLRTQKGDAFYSVASGKSYENFYDYLIDGLQDKIKAIAELDIDKRAADEIISIATNPENRGLYIADGRISLVHGDLVIHNLLTDGAKLTGVLDWELALYGDPEYDLIRLFYYQECAKSYSESGADEIYEADFMEILVAAISNSGLIEDKEVFAKKYIFCRSIFFINSFFWLVGSNGSKEDIARLTEQWNRDKMRGAI